MLNRLQLGSAPAMAMSFRVHTYVFRMSKSSAMNAFLRGPRTMRDERCED